VEQDSPTTKKASGSTTCTNLGAENKAQFSSRRRAGIGANVLDATMMTVRATDEAMKSDIDSTDIHWPSI
jgi:hypothetical protein